MARKYLRKNVSEDVAEVSFSISFQIRIILQYFSFFWILYRIQKKKKRYKGILICTACSLLFILLPSARAELGNTFIITLAEAGNRK